MNKTSILLLVLVGCLVASLYIIQDTIDLKVKHMEWKADTPLDKTCNAECSKIIDAQPCGRKNKNCCKKGQCESRYLGASYHCKARVYLRGCTEELLATDCEKICTNTPGRTLCSAQNGKHCCANGCDQTSGGCRRGTRGPTDTGIVQIAGCRMLIK